MLLTRRILAGAIICSVIGCSQMGLDTRMEYGSRVGAGADLSKVKTYDWLPAQHPPTGNPRIDHTELIKYIETLVGREMNKRGIEKSSDSPDCMINYDVGIQYEQDDPNWMWAYSQDQFQNNEATWEEGSLMLMFFNPKDGQAMWAGWAHGELDPNADKKSAKRNLEKVVDQIFRKFDVDRGMASPDAKTDYEPVNN